MSSQDNLQSGRNIGRPGLKSLIEPPPLVLTRNLSIAQLPSPILSSAGSISVSVPVSMDNTETQPENFDPYPQYYHKPCFKISSELDLHRLLRLPGHIHELKILKYYLKYLSDTLAPKMSTVRELAIIDCSLESFITHGYPNSLRSLRIHSCLDLKFPPPHKFPLLETLHISSSCKWLDTFPLDLFPKLSSLILKDCPNLVSISAETSLCLPAFKYFQISDCPNLTSFPDAGLPTPNLILMGLSNCSNLTKLPKFLDSLTHLEFLELHRCPNLESFSTSLPSNLVLLSIISCDKFIPKKEWGLYNLNRLKEFKIEGECLGLKTFPEEDLLPVNLLCLCVSSLLSLETVGSGLCHLTALCSLEIFSCPKLQSFPKECVPSSLVYLCIKKCPELTPKLVTAHISLDKMRSVEINDTVISTPMHW